MSIPAPPASLGYLGSAGCSTDATGSRKFCVEDRSLNELTNPNPTSSLWYQKHCPPLSCRRRWTTPIKGRGAYCPSQGTKTPSVQVPLLLHSLLHGQLSPSLLHIRRGYSDSEHSPCPSRCPHISLLLCLFLVL